MEVFNVDCDETLTGATVLVFGKLFVSKSEKKKWYIRITDDSPGKIFIKLKK